MKGLPAQATKRDTSAQGTGQQRRALGGQREGSPSGCRVLARLAGERGSPDGPLLRLPALPADKTRGPRTRGQTRARELGQLPSGEGHSQQSPAP